MNPPKFLEVVETETPKEDTADTAASQQPMEVNEPIAEEDVPSFLSRNSHLVLNQSAKRPKIAMIFGPIAGKNQCT